MDATGPSRSVSLGQPSTLTDERWRSGTFLPHFDVPGLVQHITFHLAGWLPKEAIKRMQTEVDLMPESNRTIARRQRIQKFLDQGIGSCVLRHPDSAEIVPESLLFGDGERSRLFAWVFMPTNVHVLIEQFPGWPLWKMVKAWKRDTSRQIHRPGFGIGESHRAGEEVDCKSTIRGGSALLQRDYRDRYIRNDRHFVTAKQYVEANPVTADLVDSSEKWPWGSAGSSRDSECANPPFQKHL